MEDRFYSNRYFVNRPVKSRTKEKYWIYLTIACMLLLLTGIVLLVVFLVPKHKLPYSGMNTKIREMAEEEMNRFHRKTTPKPLLPSRDYDIDPRSDFDAEDEEIEPDFIDTTTTNPVYIGLTSSLHPLTRTNGRFNKTFTW